MREPGLADQYLRNTGVVLRAGRHLHKCLQTDDPGLQFAINRLEAAASEQGTEAAQHQAFMFSRMETGPPVSRQSTAEGLLANMLAEVETANVLMAAAQAVGETGERDDARRLERALEHLESTQQSIEHAQAGGAAPGRLGFAELTSTPDFPQGFTTESFTELAERTLHSFVDEARGVVLVVLKGLDPVDIHKFGDELAALDRLATAREGLGRLFSQGWAKLRGVIESLDRLFGAKALAAVGECVEMLRKDFKEGKVVVGLVERAIAIESVRQLVKTTLELKNPEEQALVLAGNELAELKLRFRENMALARLLSTGIGVSVKLVMFTSIAAQGAVAVAGAYGLILAAVILIGRDYAGSGGVLNWVRGVKRIVTDLAATAPAASDAA
jgi:hypothetical protein